MTIVVEDGTALSTAEAYISVAAADARMAARGVAAWAALATPEKEQALRRATDYMLQVYRQRWAGTRYSDAQALDWPRFLVPKVDSPGGYRSSPSYYPTNMVPVEVQNACADLAYRASTGELSPDIDPQVASESVGPLSVSYIPGSRQTVQYRAVDNMLKLLLLDSIGNGIRLVRA